MLNLTSFFEFIESLSKDYWNDYNESKYDVDYNAKFIDYLEANNIKYSYKIKTQHRIFDRDIKIFESFHTIDNIISNLSDFDKHNLYEEFRYNHDHHENIIESIELVKSIGIINGTDILSIMFKNYKHILELEYPIKKTSIRIMTH